VLAFTALLAADEYELGEPHEPLPPGLCSGQLVTVRGSSVTERIEMSGLRPLGPIELADIPARGLDASRSQWGTAVVEGWRRIRVRFRDGRERLYAGPWKRVVSTAWSPDGRFLAYTYDFGALGLGHGLSDSRAVGILALSSGTNYRLWVADPLRKVFVQDGERMEWDELKPPASTAPPITYQAPNDKEQ